jgi:hypothetical protein
MCLDLPGRLRGEGERGYYLLTANTISSVRQRGWPEWSQVPAPRAFVRDETGLVEKRRDAGDLSHLCCSASGT